MKDHRKRQGALDDKVDKEIADRMDRLMNASRSENERDLDDWDPDRQPKAPGGGRTRSR